MYLTVQYYRCYLISYHMFPVTSFITIYSLLPHILQYITCCLIYYNMFAVASYIYYNIFAVTSYLKICSLVPNSLSICSYLICILLYYSQGWEFAQLISERIARFLSKNERMRDLLKKKSDSLILSFLVSEMSDSLTSLIFGEQNERFAHIAHIL